VEKRSNEDLQRIHNIGKYLTTNKAYGDSGHRDSYLQVHNFSHPLKSRGIKNTKSLDFSRNNWRLQRKLALHTVPY